MKKMLAKIQMKIGVPSGSFNGFIQYNEKKWHLRYNVGKNKRLSAYLENIKNSSEIIQLCHR